MTIYWTIKSIPELAQLPPKKQRRVWRRAYGRAFGHWQTWAAWALCGVLGVLGSNLGRSLGAPLLGAAIGGGLGGFVASQIMVYVARSNKYFF